MLVGPMPKSKLKLRVSVCAPAEAAKMAMVARAAKPRNDQRLFGQLIFIFSPDVIRTFNFGHWPISNQYPETVERKRGMFRLLSSSWQLGLYGGKPRSSRDAHLHSPRT